MKNFRLSKPLVALGILGLTLSVGLACRQSETSSADEAAVAAESASTTPRRTPLSTPIARSIDQGIGYFNAQNDSNELFIFYLLHFLERRFELGVWQSAPERHARFLEALDERMPQKELFRRLIEPDYRVTREELAGVEDVADKVTTAALYCRDHPLGDDYPAKLRKLAVGGRYHTTHAALAIQWMRENGCGPIPTDIASYVVDLMAAAIQVGDRSSDLELERAAFLGYLGHADRIPTGFVRDIIRLQNADGGWSVEARGPSNWHPTFMALWVLLESEGRGNGAPWIIAEAD